jgi:hypothetical protein
MDGWTEEFTYVNMEPRSEERGTTGSWTLQIRSTTVGRRSMVEPEGLGSRNHGEVESDSTLGSSNGTDWVSRMDCTKYLGTVLE